MKYRRIAKLGRGGMGEITLAVSQGPGGFNKLVVLKELRDGLADDPEFTAMFMNEARVCAQLQHPNIVHTYDVVSDESGRFMILEYLQGQPLNKVRALDNWRSFPLPLHLRVISDMLAGLHYAHSLSDLEGNPMNLVHRDVSPQNVVVCYDGLVKLMDFGVAKVRGARTETAAGVFKGKLAYLAPEILGGEGMDRRADLFSAGVMLWEALARRKINLGRTDLEIAGARVSGRDPPASVVLDAPDELIAVCKRAMAFRPDDRFATAEEFREELNKHIPDDCRSPELGAFVASRFAEKRESFARLVQDQISRQPNEDETLPSLALTSTASNSLPSVIGPEQTATHDFRGRYQRSRGVGSPSDPGSSTSTRPKLLRGRPWLILATLLLPALGIILWAESPPSAAGVGVPTSAPASVGSIPSQAPVVAVSSPSSVPDASMEASIDGGLSQDAAEIRPVPRFSMRRTGGGKAARSAAPIPSNDEKKGPKPHDPFEDRH